jgi:hypothetical protein
MSFLQTPELRGGIMQPSTSIIISHAKEPHIKRFQEENPLRDRPLVRLKVREFERPAQWLKTGT